VRKGSIPFVKAHGLGNDFLLLREESSVGFDLPQLARRICDRHTSLGADGIVILGKAADVDASFRVYNSDGSQATLSGNALRCAAAMVATQRHLTSGKLVFETSLGRRQLELIARKGNSWIFRAEMGAPEFSAARITFHPGRPVTEPIVGFEMPVGDARMAATILFMGNPQCIVFPENLDALDWRAAGAQLERHAYFPDRANIGFVRILSRDKIEVRFWERGAGHTLASGTGSCACAVAANLNKKTGRRVHVVLERGEMEVNWREDGMVELTGPAEIVAEGALHLDA